MTDLSRDRLLEELRRSTGDVTQVLRAGDLAARVPACPGFDLADLAVHLGNVHRWATAALRTTEPPTLPTDGPASGEPLADWYAGTARALLDALQVTDPDTPCFTFGPPRTAAFWLRRQVHETAIHLFDAWSAVGSASDLDAQLAADGIDEVLIVFLPRQVALGRTPAVEQPVALHAIDTGGTWVVGDGAPVATVRGPAYALLLLLWKRTSLDELQVEGDPRATLSQALTP